jgi:hypothetical protein
MFKSALNNAKKSALRNQQEQQTHMGNADLSVVRMTILCDWCLTDDSRLRVGSEENVSSKIFLKPEVLIPTRDPDISPFSLNGDEKLTTRDSETLKRELRTTSSSSSSRPTKPPVPARPKSSNASLRAGWKLQASSRVSAENLPLFAGGMIMVDCWD